MSIGRFTEHKVPTDSSMEYPGFYIGGDEESVRKAHANFSAQGVVYYLEETDHAENNIIAILFALLYSFS